MATYTIWSQATETISATGSNGGGSIGLEFSVSSSSTLTALWLYSPSGHSLAALPTSMALYTVSGTTLVVSQTSVVWSNTVGTGWVRAAFTSPPSLTASTNYMAVLYRTSGSNWFVYTTSYGFPVTAGIITAPSGQGFYTTSLSGISYPSSQLSGDNWWLDVEVTTAVTHSAAAALSGSGTFTALVTGSGAAHLSGTGTLRAAPNTINNVILDEASGAVLDESGADVLDESGYAPVISGAAALTGSGTLSASGAFTASAALSGTGTLSAAPTGTRSRIAVLSGTGTLTPVASNSFGAAALSGAGTLTAAGELSGTAALSGSGTLTAQPAVALLVSVYLSGTGTLIPFTGYTAQWLYTGYETLTYMNATPVNGGSLVLVPGESYDIDTPVPFQLRGHPYFGKTDFKEN